MREVKVRRVRNLDQHKTMEPGAVAVVVIEGLQVWPCYLRVFERGKHLETEGLAGNTTRMPRGASVREAIARVCEEAAAEPCMAKNKKAAKMLRSFAQANRLNDQPKQTP